VNHGIFVRQRLGGEVRPVDADVNTSAERGRRGARNVRAAHAVRHAADDFPEAAVRASM